MALVSIIILIFAHSLALTGAYKRLKRRQLPLCRHFAVLSVILFYDIGLMVELLPSGYNSDYFGAFYSTPDSTQSISYLFILLAPFLFLIGASLTGSRTESPANESNFRPLGLFVFLLVALAVSTQTSRIGYAYTLLGLPPWALSREVSSDWGSKIVVLYLPLHLLAFFIVKKNVVNVLGLSICILLSIASVFSTLPINERTNYLLPVLMLFMFWGVPSVSRLVLGGVTTLVLAALLLPMLRWQHNASSASVSTLLLKTLETDMARAQVVAESVSRSPIIGTNIMPFPCSGYVYSAFFFVPRVIAPFKGQSSASHFTAKLTNTRPETITWGLGLGAIEELAINAGILLVIPGLLVYGIAIGLLERLTQRSSSTQVPAKLASLWICGYHLPAILLTFGAMGMFCYVLDRVFLRMRLIYPTPIKSAVIDKRS